MDLFASVNIKKNRRLERTCVSAAVELDPHADGAGMVTVGQEPHAGGNDGGRQL